MKFCNQVSKKHKNIYPSFASYLSFVSLLLHVEKLNQNTKSAAPDEKLR